MKAGEVANIEVEEIEGLAIGRAGPPIEGVNDAIINLLLKRHNVAILGDAWEFAFRMNERGQPAVPDLVGKASAVLMATIAGESVCA